MINFCSKITKSGVQCSRKVKLSEIYCFQHLNNNNEITIEFVPTIWKIFCIPTDIINIIYSLLRNKDQWSLLQVSLAYNKSIKDFHVGFPKLWQKQFSLQVIKRNNYFNDGGQFDTIIIATHGIDYDFLKNTITELCLKTSITPIKVQYSGPWDIAIMKRWSIPKIQNNKNYFKPT